MKKKKELQQSYAIIIRNKQEKFNAIDVPFSAEDWKKLIDAGKYSTYLETAFL